MRKKVCPETRKPVAKEEDKEGGCSFFWVFWEEWDGDWTLEQGAKAILSGGRWMTSYTISLLSFPFPRRFTREGFFFVWKAQSMVK